MAFAVTDMGRCAATKGEGGTTVFAAQPAKKRPSSDDSRSEEQTVPWTPVPLQSTDSAPRARTPPPWLEEYKNFVSLERAQKWEPPPVVRYPTKTINGVTVTTLAVHTLDALADIVDGPCVLALDIDYTVIGGTNQQLRRHHYRQFPALTDQDKAVLFKENGLME